MNNAEKVINHIKDGYFWTIEKVQEHPHVFVWAVICYGLIRR